jgi:hypothetical protein
VVRVLTITVGTALRCTATLNVLQFTEDIGILAA